VDILLRVVLTLWPTLYLVWCVDNSRSYCVAVRSAKMLLHRVWWESRSWMDTGILVCRLRTQWETSEHRQRRRFRRRRTDWRMSSRRKEYEEHSANFWNSNTSRLTVRQMNSFYRVMHYSAKRGIEIACRLSVRPSVRPSVTVGASGSHRLEILETNCTDNYPSIFALPSLKAIHLIPGEHGKILGRLEVGWESGVMEHKSGNISETRKDRRKVTMEGL